MRVNKTRQGRSILTALAGSGAQTAEETMQVVEKLTGRPIRVQALPELKNEPVCGAWVGLDHADLLFLVPTESSLSREQIIFHELGHMVLGHEGTSTMGSYVAGLVPNLPRDAVVRALGRGQGGDASEQAAEAFADQIAGVLRDNRRGRTPFSRVFS